MRGKIYIDTNKAIPEVTTYLGFPPPAKSLIDWWQQKEAMLAV